MGDTWRATLDSRAISALFLLVESRYHQTKLPRPPREAMQAGRGGGRNARRIDAGVLLPGSTKKVTAQYSKISALTPLSVGVNLRVKVVEPIQSQVS